MARNNRVVYTSENLKNDPVTKNNPLPVAFSNYTTVEDLLSSQTQILDELKKINIQLAIITGNDLNKEHRI